MQASKLGKPDIW